MFAMIQKLYKAGKLTTDGVKNAVAKKWVTKEEYKLITGEEYQENDND